MQAYTEIHFTRCIYKLYISYASSKAVYCKSKLINDAFTTCYSALTVYSMRLLQFTHVSFPRTIFL